ncbi:hypothetical protein NEAUS06_0378 [Nematocida ausubeli]|nr:hypothetical protein NEAUS06_0378 [Nematocida ausubeli]
MERPVVCEIFKEPSLLECLTRIIMYIEHLCVAGNAYFLERLCMKVLSKCIYGRPNEATNLQHRKESVCLQNNLQVHCKHTYSWRCAVVYRDISVILACIMAVAVVDLLYIYIDICICSTSIIPLCIILRIVMYRHILYGDILDHTTLIDADIIFHCRYSRIFFY